jgi:hypothetical protein
MLLRISWLKPPRGASLARELRKLAGVQLVGTAYHARCLVAEVTDTGHALLLQDGRWQLETMSVTLPPAPSAS